MLHSPSPWGLDTIMPTATTCVVRTTVTHHVVSWPIALSWRGPPWSRVPVSVAMHSHTSSGLGAIHGRAQDMAGRTSSGLAGFVSLSTVRIASSATWCELGLSPHHRPCASCHQPRVASFGRHLTIDCPVLALLQTIGRGGKKGWRPNMWSCGYEIEGRKIQTRGVPNTWRSIPWWSYSLQKSWILCQQQSVT